MAPRRRYKARDFAARHRLGSQLASRNPNPNPDPNQGVSNASLTVLLEPLLSEEVRRELRVRQAFEEGVIDETERFTLETTIGRREPGYG